MKKIMIIGIILIAVFLFGCTNQNATKTEQTNTAGLETNSEVIKINLSEINEEAKWYDYELENTTITYFVVKANDGTIKTAFNACDVCFRNKKGYNQEGEVMVCNNCGNRYPLSGLGTENIKGGGCWPGYLPSEINGEELIIKIADLKAGEYRFK